MAKKSEIQYIRLYTDGSSACSVDFSTPEKKSKTRLPKVRKERKLLIRLDPVALCGILVASVMLVLMFVGSIQLIQSQREVEQMHAYVAQLQNKNAQLQMTYESGYNLETVEQMALALGLVPEAQVRHITVQTEEPEMVQEPTWWEKASTFLTGLFA